MRNVRSFASQTVAPGWMPVSLAEAKAELRILDDDSEDCRIEDAIQAATELVEEHSLRRLASQAWKLVMDCFPDEIELSNCPVQSVESITYISGGVELTLAPSSYQTDIVTEPARIRPALGACWPSTDYVLNAVTVNWIAGYQSPDFVPRRAKAAVLEAVSRLYEGCPLGDVYWMKIGSLKTYGYL